MSAHHCIRLLLVLQKRATGAAMIGLVYFIPFTLISYHLIDEAGSKFKKDTVDFMQEHFLYIRTVRI